ncbi:MAG: GNAT family N-acetyltransferase [Verrucomicrobiales bacterium]
MSLPVSIRPVQISDADSVQKYASDVRLHATCNLPSPYPEGGAIAFLTGAIQAEETGGNLLFAIMHADEFVGLMGLNGVRPAEGTADLDYWLGFPFWGRGIATRAASLVISHAFQNLNLITLFSGGLVRNRASLRVLEKNGFTKIEEHVYGGPFKDRFGGEMMTRFHLHKHEYNSMLIARDPTK